MSTEPVPQVTGPIRFAAFELDPRSGVLRKHGVRIRLQEQPIRVLLALLERPGEVVTREELQEKVWTGISFGDFDHRLNISVNKIREALGDSAATPRFIETIPRRGYRFIGAAEGPALPVGVSLPVVVPRAAARKSKWVALAAVLCLVIAAAALWLRPSASPAQLQMRRLTNDNSAKFGPVLSDGARLYFQAGSEFDSYIVQLPQSGGEPSRLPMDRPPGVYINLLDIKPDRQELLLSASDWRHPESAPLWTVRIADGSIRRVGALLATDAAYSPKGERIVFTMGRQSTPGSLWVASNDGSNPRRVLERQGAGLVAPFWSPDGQWIAFGQIDQSSHRESAWQVMVDGSGVRQVLPDWQGVLLPAGWAPDGNSMSVLTAGSGESQSAGSSAPGRLRHSRSLRVSLVSLS